MKLSYLTVLAALLSTSASASAQPADLAAKFGALEGVFDAALSPDGTKISFIGPVQGQATALYVFDTVAGGAPKRILTSSGDPEIVAGCDWVANDRLVCQVGGYSAYGTDIIGFNNVIAVDADGSNVKLLSKRQGTNALYGDLRGGGLIDFVPGEDGIVLMMRAYVPEAKIGSLVKSDLEGMGVDRIDTRTLETKRVEQPKRDAVEYISDGKGKVRVVGYVESNAAGYATGKINYRYRAIGSNSWNTLSELDYLHDAGFNPYAVDPTKNVAYGFEKVDSRQALVEVALDGSMAKRILLARPDVDVDGLIRIGKSRRVVGASYATERREAVYFDPAIKALAATLAKALPQTPLIQFVDSSEDETKLLLWAGSDTNPGQYYLFDRTAKKLSPVIPSRGELVGLAMGSVEPINYEASDNIKVPGYLTLPPGSSGKNLPAIVMPHGGPSARDEWGFDWLAQYYVSRGFAVLQPNYRGSSGYGDAWYQDNGFQSWRTAINDVTDAGRWMVQQGIADPSKLFIVGWSYGGYAALQSAVVDPGLFKAVVAIAPVTDLASFTRDDRNSYNYRVRQAFIGSGPHIKEGSPAQNAEAIQVPVLMFHGDLDRNVSIDQSRLMAERLKAAGKRYELIEYPKLEHGLRDSRVRAQVLQKSSDFLLAAVK